MHKSQLPMAAANADMHSIYRDCIRRAAEMVGTYRAQAPAGFDPRNEGPAVAEKKDGIETDPELMEMVHSRLGFPLPKAEKTAPQDPADPEDPEDPQDPENLEDPEDPNVQTDPQDPADPEDPEDPQDPENPEDPEDPADPTAPELSEEQQAYVDQLVTEKTGELEQKLAAAEAQVAELTSKGTAAVQSARVHPLMLASSADEVAEIDKDLAEFEKWAVQHWDGVQAEKEGEPSYTKEEVRGRYADVKELREQLVPQARELVKQRAVWEPVIRKTYPALYDAKTPEFKVAQALLKTVPELRQFPNAMMIIGDSLRGEKIRLAAEKAAKAAAEKKTEKAGNGKAAPAKNAAKPKAPKLPTNAKPGGASAVVTKTKPGGSVDLKGFVSNGGDRNALVATIMKANLVQ